MAAFLVSTLFITGTPNSANATDFSGFTNQQLADKLQESAGKLERISAVIDEAAILDIANQTSIGLRERVENTVSDQQAKTKLLRIVDASRTVLSSTESFVIGDLDETGARKMLNATDNVLEAFVSAVNSERGKRISSTVADDLIANATAVSSLLNKTDDDVKVDILGRQTPLASQLFTNSTAEIETIQDIIAEFQSRGIQVQIDAQSGSPLRLVLIVVNIVQISIKAPSVALSTTNAVDDALIDGGYSPLTENEKLSLFLLNEATYAGISVLVDDPGAKLLFKGVGHWFDGEITARVLSEIFFTDTLTEEIYQQLEPTMIQFEKDLILKLRNIYANKIVTGNFHDINGNGVDNANESGLQSWNITLYKLGGAKMKSILTDVDGLVFFTGLIDGNYTITSEVKTGWNASTPVSKNIELESGHREHNNNDFGFYNPGRISGMKFNDADNGGDKDAGESGLAGWTIRLKNATSGVIVITNTTDASGAYVFSSVRPGNYTVEEVQQSGWTQTYPASGTYGTTISSGAIITSKDFGNYQSLPGSVGYWQFDESTGTSAADSSGNGNTGTLINGASFTSTNCVSGNCIQFDGNDDRVSVPSNSNLNIESALTVAAWVNVIDLPSSSQQNNIHNSPIIVAKGPINSQYLIFISGAAGAASGTAPFTFRINTGVDDPTSRNQLVTTAVSSTTKVTFGQWMHVVGVYDGSSLKIYVNGVLEGTAAASGNIATDTRALTIGAGANDLYMDNLPVAWSNLLHGSADQVLIYNKALTAQEVQQLYQAN